MNVAVIGAIQLFRARNLKRATGAESYDDLAGQGRNHVGLGLAMTVACLSLAGVPLTAGFLGKLYLTGPAAHADLIGLSVTLWVNAAISAAYYLRLIATMFLRPEPTDLFGPAATPPPRLPQPPSVVIAVGVSVVLTVLFGAFPPATRLLQGRVTRAAQLAAPVGTPAEPVAVTTAVVPHG